MSEVTHINNFNKIDIKEYKNNKPNDYTIDNVISGNNINSSTYNSSNDTEIYDFTDKTLNDLINNYSAIKDVFNSNQYGGSQNSILTILRDFYIDRDSLSEINKQKAQLIITLIKNKFPNITDKEIYDFGSDFYQHGCAYISAANIICTYFGSVKNGENIFKEKFGYDLYLTDDTGNKYYNYEAIAVDMLMTHANYLINDDMSIKAYTPKLIHSFVHYNDEDLSVKVSTGKGPVLKTANTDVITLLEKMQSITTGNVFYQISCNNFLLTKLDGTNEIIKIDGGHAMTITGVDDNNNIIVSSWGRKYILSFDETCVKDDSYMIINAIHFVEGDEND